MKKLLKVLSLLILIPLAANTQTNRALFVGIDKYHPDFSWKDIHGTNDRELVIPMLKKHGYATKNIKEILNTQATKDNVVEALRRLQRETSTGDYIYIHFSCHGQQIADDNGDEQDGLDEALIFYDTERKYAEGRFIGKNHLRDDDIEKLLNSIRLKTGPSGNVIVAFDACNSATADRDYNEKAPIRGGEEIFAPPGYKYKASKEPLSVSTTKDNRMAPLTVFSASHTLSYEHKYNGKFYGSLSFALHEIFKSKPTSTGVQLEAALTHVLDTMFRAKDYSQKPYFESTDANKIINLGR